MPDLVKKSEGRPDKPLWTATDFEARKGYWRASSGTGLLPWHRRLRRLERRREAEADVLSCQLQLFHARGAQLLKPLDDLLDQMLGG